MLGIDVQYLTRQERLDLMARLWDSLEGELDRRLAHADADLPCSSPWQDVQAELRHRPK